MNIVHIVINNYGENIIYIGTHIAEYYIHNIMASIIIAENNVVIYIIGRKVIIVIPFNSIVHYIPYRILIFCYKLIKYVQ